MKCSHLRARCVDAQSQLRKILQRASVDNHTKKNFNFILCLKDL